MSTVSLPAIVAITLLLIPTLSVALSSCNAGENVKERCDAGENEKERCNVGENEKERCNVGENEKCDLYKGSWILDESYPLYASEKCPYIIQQFNCAGNGRPDLKYQKYRWQPNNCDLPRWDGVGFVERMRGKSIMFVGDSLSMNQWQSLACMIHAAIPNASYHPPTTTGLLSTILFPVFYFSAHFAEMCRGSESVQTEILKKEYNVTLMLLRQVLLADVILDNGTKVIKLDSVSDTSRHWLESDILIFDTWHWWLRKGRKKPWNLLQEGNVTMTDMDRFEAYEKVLRTWGRWVDQNVDLAKVKIFFQGVSADHWNSSVWGLPEMHRCGGEQDPFEQPIEESTSTTRANIILKEVLMSMNKTIHLLDITELSQFRVDGHPANYGNPKHYGMDCTHWCLPGVPDIWNELLYATLLTL